MAKAKNFYGISVVGQVDENALSKALFVSRFFTVAALLYLAVGSFLYWREFMVNTAALGFGPAAVWVSFGVIGAEVAVSILLLLGWHTRISTLFAIPISVLGSLIFFAQVYNPIFIVICLLFFASFTILIWLGAGRFSLDYTRSQRAAQLRIRGKL